MSSYLNFVFLTLLLVGFLGIRGQNSALTIGLNKPRQTRALIIGISNYQHPQIKDLNYADNDAKAFYEFLISPVGGRIDSSNIKLLVNETATAGRIYRSLDWLLNHCEEGDLVYIFFSGHGDIEYKTDDQHGFLLAFDSSPSYYFNSGSLGTNILQSYINTLVRKRVSTYLFVDACNSGELAGGYKGHSLTNEALQRINGTKVKLLSAGRGEASYEGKKWGNGIFSYYLLRGLTGAANDENNDNFISLWEIYQYLRLTVRSETQNDQNPIAQGNWDLTLSDLSQSTGIYPEKYNKSIAFGMLRADSIQKERINSVRVVDVEKLISYPDTIKFSSISNSVSDSLFLILKLIKQFNQALDSSLFLPPPDKKCAKCIYDSLLQFDDPILKEKLPELKAKLIEAVIEYSQIQLEYYRKYHNYELIQDRIIYADESLNYTLSLLPKEHPLFNSLKAMQLFFHSFDIQDKVTEALILKKSIEYDSTFIFPFHRLVLIHNFDQDKQVAEIVWNTIKNGYSHFLKEMFLSLVSQLDISSPEESSEVLLYSYQPLTRGSGNVPYKVVQSFEMEYMEAYHVRWKRKRRRYIAEFQLRRYNMEAFFYIDGTWLYTDIKVPFDEFPAKAKSYYQTQMSNVIISRTGYHDSNSGGFYYIIGHENGQRRQLLFDDSGNFLGTTD